MSAPGTLFVYPPGVPPGGGGKVAVGRAAGRTDIEIDNDGSNSVRISGPVTACNLVARGAAGGRSNVGARLTALPVDSPGVSLTTAIGAAAVVPGGLRFEALAGPLGLARGGTGESNFSEGALLYLQGGRLASDPALAWDPAAGGALLSGSSVTFSGSNVTGESPAYTGRITFFRTA